MKTYNNFNEMFVSNKQNSNLSVFNKVQETTKYAYGVDGSGERVGSYEIIVKGNPYLQVFYYGDNDIQNDNLTQNDSGGFDGVAFGYAPNFDDCCDGDDLVETLFFEICEDSGRDVLDESPNDAMDFDFPLSRQEAFELATSIDSSIQDYIIRHPEC